MFYWEKMKIKFVLLTLILILLYIFRNSIKKNEFLKSMGKILNIVFYIYLIALIGAFVHQIISNLSG